MQLVLYLLMKLSLLFIIFNACANHEQLSHISTGSKAHKSPSLETSPVPQDDFPELQSLIKEGKVKISEDGNLKIISVFGPNQYQTTGTYDCWIHAPFNAWRLFNGESIESFTGKDWEKNLIKEVNKFKKDEKISGSYRSPSSACLSGARILQPLVNSEDFSNIDIKPQLLGLQSKEIAASRYGSGTTSYFPLDPSIITSAGHITRDQYKYFSDAQAKDELKEFEEYIQKCEKALPKTKGFYEIISKPYKCLDILKEKLAKNTYSDPNLRVLIDNYLSGKNPDFVYSLINYYFYDKLIKAFGDKIKRLRQGHYQVLILGFQKSSNEYPLDHAVAAKIMPSNANKIIVINSENRHLEPNKTLRMLHNIFNIPLPQELQ